MPHLRLLCTILRACINPLSHWRRRPARDYFRSADQSPATPLALKKARNTARNTGKTISSAPETYERSKEGAIFVTGWYVRHNSAAKFVEGCGWRSVRQLIKLGMHET